MVDVCLTACTRFALAILILVLLNLVLLCWSAGVGMVDDIAKLHRDMHGYLEGTAVSHTHSYKNITLWCCGRSTFLAL